MSFIMSSHFFDKLLGLSATNPGYHFEGVQRWTKKIDIFQTRILLFPTCIGNHWFLYMVDVESSTITLLDSLHDHNRPEYSNALIR